MKIRLHICLGSIYAGKNQKNVINAYISSLGALEFTIRSMEVLFTDMISTGAIPALPTRVSLPEVPRSTAWVAYPVPVKATWF